MLENDPLWYKDAIIYELHVRAFHDSVGDGMGTFGGLTAKLDYLQDLGITAIWLLPFYPSPLRDDGYDIADYSDIHPQYGTLADFQEFLDAAHQRGIRVITELVINHTSDQHPWFQRARRSPPGSTARDFYVWSDTPEKYKEARIIFKDFEHSNWSYDHVAKAYFWHRFYSHQPDLNYDSPAVWDAIFPVLDFWMGLGVDGMRLDAVPYLYEREGTSCENLPETHAFLRGLRKHVDAKFANRMLLSEANQWPEDSVAYFGHGDESHMAFHFPLMPRMFMAIHMEDRFPIMDILAQTPTIPDGCQWGLFLRNHDELTLEMVTDEERDYMYRAYAGDRTARINLGIRRRLAPLLGNNRRRIELMNGLLFSLPGTPVIYYGDEIGMGDNIYLGDRNGVRTPMQWSPDRNAGFSRANPQKLYLPVIIDPEYHFESVNVEAQQNNPSSLLWWMKRLIALRKRYKAFGRGTLEFLPPANRKVLAFVRRWLPSGSAHPDEEERILVIANLSRFVQPVELDLSKFHGMVPVEMFGRNRFPKIGKSHYTLTLGPHAFYWFFLESAQQLEALEQTGTEEPRWPIVTVTGPWDQLTRRPAREDLEAQLPGYLQKQHWGGGGYRLARSALIREMIPLRYGDTSSFVCLVEAGTTEGLGDTYIIPITLVQGDAIVEVLEKTPDKVIAALRGERDGLIVDALGQPAFGVALLHAISQGRRFHLEQGEVQAIPSPALEPYLQEIGTLPPPVRQQEEQTHTSLLFGDRLTLKVFRKLEEGIHPEVEMARYLTERKSFSHVAPILGVIERRRRKSEPMLLAVLHAWVRSEGTAWQYTLDELSRFFERVLALPADQRPIAAVHAPLLDLTDAAVPAAVHELTGGYLDSVRLLGQRTGELHCALAAETDDPAFAPEPFTKLYQRSLYQSVRNIHRYVLDHLAQALPTLPEPAQKQARQLLDRETEVLGRFQILLDRRFTGQRTRCHGDYNLSEILYTGKDFIVIDFEGEPSRSLADRRVKRSPLQDVACMIRSFHFAAATALAGNGTPRGHVPGVIRPEDIAVLEPWGWTWYLWVSAVFLKEYLATAAKCAVLPQSREELAPLLDFYLLEKSMRELGYDLAYRPSGAGIPLQGILQLMDGR
jgi:maltose alpha-D-glucosyltransferase / alpha-amylase